MNIFEIKYYLFITIYLHSELINLIIVSNENFRFGKNRVIFHCISAFRVPLKKRLTKWIKINIPPFKRKEWNNEIINTSLVSYNFWNFLSCYQYTRWIHSTVKINWAPSCLVYSICHNSAFNYNIYLLNSSKVKEICINRNYYDFYVLSVKIHGFPIKFS